MGMKGCGPSPGPCACARQRHGIFFLHPHFRNLCVRLRRRVRRSPFVLRNVGVVAVVRCCVCRWWWSVRTGFWSGFLGRDICGVRRIEEMEMLCVWEETCPLLLGYMVVG